MENLPKFEQEKVKKLSSLQLKAKLVTAGRSEADVEKLSRAELMAAVAELKWQKMQGEAAARPLPESPETVKEKMDLEKARLEFERQKWEADRQERLAKEEADRQERLAEQEFQRKKWENEQRLKERQLEEEQKRREDERNNTLHASKNNHSPTLSSILQINNSSADE